MFEKSWKRTLENKEKEETVFISAQDANTNLLLQEAEVRVLAANTSQRLPGPTPPLPDNTKRLLPGRRDIHLTDNSSLPFPVVPELRLAANTNRPCAQALEPKEESRPVGEFQGRRPKRSLLQGTSL